MRDAKPDLAAVERHLWRQGDLRLLLSRPQREVAELFEQASGRRFVLCCSRRYGKSSVGLNIANATCIKKPGAKIRYAAPTAKMVENIITPLMETLLRNAPSELIPKHKEQRGVWLYPNGSELHVAGCEKGGANRLRGTAADLWIIDEANDVDDLWYVIKDILQPQTLTNKGRGLVLGTPPNSPAHEFVQVCMDAMSKGRYVHRDIYSASTERGGHVTPEAIHEFIEESGGEQSTTWRREYLAQFIVDSNRAIVPEFFENKAVIVEEFTRPEYFDGSVAIDFGYNDLTFAVFGYWNFERALLEIENEAVFQRANSDSITRSCRDIEVSTWGKPPKMRVADAPLQLLSDISTLHKYPVVPARKDDKDAALNALRTAFGAGKIRIHPRCRNLIAHLENGIWNPSRTDYARSGDFGHFDGIDAMIYMWRHVDQQKNPAPKLAPGTTTDTHFIPKEKSRGPTLVPPWRQAK